MSVSCEWCVLSDRGPCVGLITRPGVLPIVMCLIVITQPRQSGGPGPWGKNIDSVIIKIDNAKVPQEPAGD